MANKVQLRHPRYESIKVTLSGTVVAGTMTKIEDTVGMYMTAGVSGDEVAFLIEAEAIILPKTAGAGIDFVAGKKVFFDNTAKTVTDVELNNIYVGVAKAAASATATEVEVKFIGTPGLPVVTS